MLKFSTRKLFAFVFLFSFVSIIANDQTAINDFFAKVKSKSNDSISFDAVSKTTNNDSKVSDLKNKFADSLSRLSFEQIDGNIKIKSSTNLSASSVQQLLIDFRGELSKTTLNSSLNFTLIVSNELCDLVGVKSSVVVPSAFSASSILLSENYTTSSILDSLSFLSNISLKNQKKFATAEDEAEDLRLRIDILYFDKDLVQHDDLALNPTTVTTGSSARFRAKGGTSEYHWRLIPSEESDATISSIIDQDITYTAGSNETRDFDVLILTDGIEEVSINIVVAKVRAEHNGSGSKGGGCFISKKFRD